MKYATRILVCIIAVSKSQEFLLKIRLFILFRRRRRRLHVDASIFPTTTQGIRLRRRVDVFLTTSCTKMLHQQRDFDATSDFTWRAWFTTYCSSIASIDSHCLLGGSMSSSPSPVNAGVATMWTTKSFDAVICRRKHYIKTVASMLGMWWSQLKFESIGRAFYKLITNSDWPWMSLWLRKLWGVVME